MTLLPLKLKATPGECDGLTSNKILEKRRARVAGPLRSFDFVQ